MNEAPQEEGDWLYRVLRCGETPQSLRSPPQWLRDCVDGDPPKFRTELILALSRGNTRTSPFLHFTRSLVRACWLHAERRHLYSHNLVRVKAAAMAGPLLLDFTPGNKGRQWLAEWSSDDLDDREFTENLGRARGFFEKDREVVLLVRPVIDHIEYFDRAERRWRPAQEWRDREAGGTQPG